MQAATSLVIESILRDRRQCDAHRVCSPYAATGVFAELFLNERKIVLRAWHVDVSRGENDYLALLAQAHQRTPRDAEKGTLYLRGKYLKLMNCTNGQLRAKSITESESGLDLQAERSTGLPSGTRTSAS